MGDTINKWLDEIIEHSFDGIYITDGKAKTIKINHSYELLTGLDRKDMLGRNMRELEQDGSISESGSLIAIREKRPVTLQQKFKTGKECLITSSPVYDDKGEVVMVVTNVRDLTELLSLQEEIEKEKKEKERMKRELNHLYDKMCVQDKMVILDGNSLNALYMADQVAPLDTTVILLGETGVGKEVFAQYVYSNSRRYGKRYIKINCGAIPGSLIENELFGYEKGAFTGADRNGRMGLFEAADGGTVFLDEIGELPLDMQVKLLRVIQEGEIKRIGGIEPKKIDVRLITATNRNLEEMVDKKLFREDLYYRLMTFPIVIPPLRERRDDIVPLAFHFLKELNAKYGFQKKLSPFAVQMIENYSWPGNIRELRNVIERAVIISRKDEITLDCLPDMLKTALHREENTVLKSEEIEWDLKKAVEEMEIRYMNRAYEKFGNVREAARSLGMNASTFVKKRQRYMKRGKEVCQK